MPLNNASLYSQQDKDEQAILLRLAQGPDPFIRKTILLNPAVPITAYALFARDPEVSLREENAIILAKKMISYSDKPEQVPEWLVSVLTMCARDVVDSVRVGMAVTLRLCGALPRGLRMLLAKDPNPEVSGPILRSCPSLTEVDCEEIIMEPTVTEITLQARSERGDLSPALTQRLHNQQGRIRDLRLLQQGLKQALEHKKSGTLTDEAVYEAAKATKGAGGQALLDAMKGQVFESPRGPMFIDAQTRDVVHNIYIRKVERVGGQLYNQEFETIKDVKDPGKTR
jgi:hypothetical protein